MIEEEQRRLAEELLFAEKKKPSFAKQLFFGRFDASQVFPFPRPGTDQKREINAYLDKVIAFADQKIDAKKIDREAKIPDEVIQGLADLGVLGMSVPKAFGGLGMSQYAYCRTTEELARRCGSTALFVNVHQSIGMRALLLFGTDKQKERWLPSLARGEKFAAFSLTEPNAGSDANGVETRAVFIPEKNVYRINGIKQWTSNGSIADVLTVMAKTEVDTARGKELKVTAFLVTPDMPGFQVTARSLDKVGMRGTWTANLAFKDLEVPAENVLGPLGGGLKVCLTVLDYGRTTFGSTCTGVAKELVKKAVAHAASRYQFNRPLASFALVKKKIAWMCAHAYAMDATTYLTAGFIDKHREDFMLESAILKVFASDALWQILYEAMQIAGGRSFFTDEPYERMMRDARLNMIGEGSNEVLRAFIAAVGMRDVGMEMKGALDSLKTLHKGVGTLGRFASSLFERFRAPHISVRFSLLQLEAHQLAKATRAFSWEVMGLITRYREEIIEKQMQLDRITNVVIALYTATAVLSKLDSDLAAVDGDAKALGNDVAVGKFYCRYALRLANSNLRMIHYNFDGESESLSDQITGVKAR